MTSEIEKFTVLYDGSKTFWKTRTILKIQIVHHVHCSCLELVCFDASTNSEFRMYLDADLIKAKLDKELITKRFQEKKDVLIRQKKPANDDEIVHSITMDMVMQYAFVRIHVPSDYALGVEPVTLMPSFDDVSLGANNPQLNIKRRIDVEIEKPETLVPFITHRQANVTAITSPVDSNIIKIKAKDLFVSTIEDMHSSYMLAVGTSPRSERSSKDEPSDSNNPLKGAKWSSSKGFPMGAHESNKVLSPKMASAPISLPPVVTSPSSKQSEQVPPMLLSPVSGGRSSPLAPLEQQPVVAQKSVLRRSQGGGSRNQLLGFFPSMDEFLTTEEREHGRDSPPIMPEATNRPPALQVARSLSSIPDEKLSSQSLDNTFKKKSFLDKISPCGVANVLSSDSTEHIPLNSHSSGINDAFGSISFDSGGFVQNEHWSEPVNSTPMSPGGIASDRAAIGDVEPFIASTLSASHISSPVPLHRKGIKTAFGVASPKSPSIPPLSPAVTADQYSNLLPVLRLPGSGVSTGQNSARTTDRSSRNSSPALPQLSSSPAASPMNAQGGGENNSNCNSPSKSLSNRPLSASKQRETTCTSPVSGRLSGRLSLVERVKHLRENSQGVIDIDSLVD